jgi:hypothetical protein
MEQPLSGGLETPVLTNIRAFLSVMAMELHETILRLERNRPGNGADRVARQSP